MVKTNHFFCIFTVSTLLIRTALSTYFHSIFNLFANMVRFANLRFANEIRCYCKPDRLQSFFEQYGIAGKQARKCFCVKRGCGAESPLRAPFRALPFRLWGSRSHLQYLNIPPYYASGFSALICLYFQYSMLHGFFSLVYKRNCKTNSVPYAIIRHTKNSQRRKHGCAIFFVGSRVEKA